MIAKSIIFIPLVAKGNHETCLSTASKALEAILRAWNLGSHRGHMTLFSFRDIRPNNIIKYAPLAKLLTIGHLIARHFPPCNASRCTGSTLSPQIWGKPSGGQEGFGKT